MNSTIPTAATFTQNDAVKLANRLTDLRHRRDGLVNTLLIYNNPDDYRRPAWIEERDALNGILAIVERGLKAIYGALEVAD